MKRALCDALDWLLFAGACFMVVYGLSRCVLTPL